MLTIHTPIDLTVDPSVLKINKNFEERLIGNYQMIGSNLEPEDMLHFLSEPPEVYLAEGGMTALIENNRITENQNLKLDVINNVINRILVSDTYRMTYQDQVFIESVLNKLGITDVQKFIRQVQNSREETKNINYLTDLYWSQQETISQLMEYQKMRKGQEEVQQDEDNNAPSGDGLWLHQKIMNRLQTAVVYQELKNYISSSTNQYRSITDAEMKISEQNITVQNMLLNKLRNYTRMEQQPLEFHYLNTYELGDEMIRQGDQHQIENQLVEAVLVNVLHQMYALRVEELLKKDNVWYQLAGSIHQATENTYNRFITYHKQGFLSEKQADIYNKQVQQYQRNEIQAIQQLYEEMQYSTIQRADGDRSPAEALIYFEEQTEGEDTPQTTIKTVPQPVTETVENTILHGQQILSMTSEERLIKERLELINQNNLKNYELLSQMNLQNLEEYTNVNIQQARAGEESSHGLLEAPEAMMTYLEQQNVTEQQNIVEKENVKLLPEGETRGSVEPPKGDHQISRYPESANAHHQGDSLLIRENLSKERELQTELVHHTDEFERETSHELEHTQVYREHLQEQTEQIQRELQRQIDRIEWKNRAEELPATEELAYLEQQAGEEQQELSFREKPAGITEMVEKTTLQGQQLETVTRQENLIKEQLEQINQKNVRNLERLSKLNLENRKETKILRINQENARKDALRVLTEPREVLMTYLESETATEKQEVVEKERLKQLFGEETIRIFETLERYQKSPNYSGNMGASGQDEAMLVKDILLQQQSVETELVHRSEELQQESIHELESTQVFREYLPEQVKQIRQENQKRIDRIELIHKKEENTLDEELVEELRGIQRVKKVENEQITQTVVEKNQTQEVINTRIHDFQTQQNEDLVRMVTDKVQNQLGSISEQIYTKLEKRMDMERRRRGL